MNRHLSCSRPLRGCTALALIATGALAFTAEPATAAAKITFSSSATQPVTRPASTVGDSGYTRKPDVAKITLGAVGSPLPAGKVVVTLVRGGKTLATIGRQPLTKLDAGKKRRFTVALKVPEALAGGPAFYRVCVKATCASAKVDLIRYPASYEGTLEVTERYALYADDQTLSWKGPVTLTRRGGAPTGTSAGEYVLGTSGLSLTGTWTQRCADGSSKTTSFSSISALGSDIDANGDLSVTLYDDRLDGGPDLAAGQDEVVALVPQPVRLVGTLPLRSAPVTVPCASGSGTGTSAISRGGYLHHLDQIDGVGWARSSYPDLSVDFTRNFSTGPVRTLLTLKPKW